MKIKKDMQKKHKNEQQTVWLQEEKNKREIGHQNQLLRLLTKMKILLDTTEMGLKNLLVLKVCFKKKIQ